MFLPVRFCRVSLSLIFIWIHEHTEQFINIFFVCGIISLLCEREEGEESALLDLSFAFGFLIVWCHQPEVVEVHQQQQDTLEASSCVLHSCTHTGERDTPSTSCRCRTGPSHFQRLAAPTTHPQLLYRECPWSTESTGLYSTPNLHFMYILRVLYRTCDLYIFPKCMLAFLLETHVIGSPSMQLVPNPGFSVRAPSSLLM